MCGIAGALWPTEPAATAAMATRMSARLAHRGPDDMGSMSLGPAALSHRRLAIIDRAGSSQPMRSADGQVALVYNGELYNFRELRAELGDRGHTFRTTGDTEVVLQAYLAWGPAFIERFRGMFALAIVDLRLRTLVLARDHFGIKPLYVLTEPGRFAFASEFQALAPEADRPELDRAAIDDYLRLGYIPAPRSAVRTIAKLPPAHRAVVSLDRPVYRPERYWRLPTPAPRARPLAECVEEAGAVIAASVRAHMVADVSFGSFLSGGVDSALVTAEMVAAGARATAFTIGFKEASHDESEQAAATAAALGVEHRIEVVRPDALGLLETLVASYGEPFGDSSAIPTWHVSRLARREVSMVLSGDGGDELFGGYDSYRGWRRWLEMPAWKRALRAALAAARPQRWPPRRELEANWLRHVAIVSDADRRALWRPELDPNPGIPPGFAGAAHGVFAPRLPQHLDLQTYLPDDILAKVDIASMAHGLEVRTPLIDLRVAEFALALPDEALSAADGGKPILRRLLAKRLPARRETAKRGFAVPLDSWLGDRTALHDRLAGSKSTLRELFRGEAIVRLCRHSPPSALWPLLVLEEWLRQWRLGRR